MQLASKKTESHGPAQGIRDTSRTDVVIERPSNRRRLVLIFAMLGTVLVLALLVYPLLTRWSQAEATVSRDRIRVATVTRGDFVRDIGASGTIVAAVSPTMFAAAEGTVTLHIHAGDTVQEGDLLAEIDSPDLASRLQQEQSTLQSAETEFERQRIEFKRRQFENQQTIDLAQVRITAAERELRRAEAAHKARAISVQDYEKARDDVDTARLEIRHAQQNSVLETEVMEFELRTNELAVERQNCSWRT